MIKFRYIALGLPLILAGCGDPLILRVPEPIVFIPDDEFFECPVVADFPNPTTLTDGQIATLLVRLDTNNRVCRDSVDAIREQLLDAQTKVEQDRD